MVVQKSSIQTYYYVTTLDLKSFFFFYKEYIYIYIIIIIIIIKLTVQLTSYKYIFGQITTYSPVVWLKFKLLTCDLKSYNASILLDSFLYYLILYFYIFCVFGGEKHKSEAKSHI